MSAAPPGDSLAGDEGGVHFDGPLLPPFAVNAARVEKGVRLPAGEQETFDAATMQQVGVVQPCDEHEQRLDQRCVGIARSAQSSVQGRQRDGEQQREALGRLLPGAAQHCSDAPRPRRGCRRHPCRMRNLATPGSPHGQVRGHRRARNAPDCTATRRCGQQTETEDRAAMRVHPLRRRQHPPFSGNAHLLQRRELCTRRSRHGDFREVVAQGEQASHERAEVHVAVCAAVHGADQPGLRIERDLGVERAYGLSSDALR